MNAETVDNAGIETIVMLATANTNMTWYHPKYYAELRKLRKQQAASYRQRKEQATSGKQQAPEDTSDKLQATSSKQQAKDS